MISSLNIVNRNIKNSWIPIEVNNTKFTNIKKIKNNIPKMYNLLETTYTPRQENLKIDLNIGIAASICDLIEFIEFNLENKIYKPSKLFLYNIAYNYYSDVVYLNDYFEILDHYGVCTENCYPFLVENIRKLPDSESILEGIKNRNYEFYNVSQNLSQLQSYLLENKPILFGMKTPIDDLKIDKTNKYFSNDKTKYHDFGNIYIAYGYDNDRQSLLIKNPLNSNIGIDGYFWLPYNIVLNRDICNEFTIISKKELRKKLSYSHDNLQKLSEPEFIDKLVLSNLGINDDVLFNIENTYNTYDTNIMTFSYNSIKASNTIFNSSMEIDNSEENNDNKLDHYSISSESKELDSCEIKINI